MGEGMIMEIFRDAMFMTFRLSAPVLVISVAVGLVIAILQAATQVHEQTLTFVPKLLAIGIVLILLGPWMMTQMNDFVFALFDIIAKYC